MPWLCLGKTRYTVNNKESRLGTALCTHRLSDIVDNNGAVGVAVVHGRKGLVAFLAGGVPDFELDSGVFIERDSLSQKSGADGRFSERVELILMKILSVGRLE